MKKSKNLIPKLEIKETESPKYLNKSFVVLDSWKNKGNEATVFLSIRFLQYDFQCFSDWNKIEMNNFWNFNEKIHKYSWQQIYQTASKTNKTGFAYMPIPIENYPDSNFKKNLSTDITIFELRVDEKIRVHGFRHESIFFLCWLDKNHSICPQK